jgi:YHS domain-containing protein
MWLLLGYVVFLIFKGRSGKREIPKESSGGGDETYQDPVCGVYVAEDDAVVGKLDGKRIHFCSMACLEKFQEQVTHKE